jgi:hypothetical protein
VQTNLCCNGAAGAGFGCGLQVRGGCQAHLGGHLRALLGQQDQVLEALPLEHIIPEQHLQMHDAHRVRTTQQVCNQPRNKCLKWGGWKSGWRSEYKVGLAKGSFWSAIPSYEVRMNVANLVQE